MKTRAPSKKWPAPSCAPATIGVFRPSFRSDPEISGRRPGKLAGKVALITGANFEPVRAIAAALAREGASVALCFSQNREEAERTAALLQDLGALCSLHFGDVSQAAFCEQLVREVLRDHDGLDILINHARENDCPTAFSRWIFRSRIFSMFHLTRAAAKHLRPGSAIINTTSFGSRRDAEADLSSSQDAVASFTRSLALSLAGQGIRVNGVAPQSNLTSFGRTASPSDLAPDFPEPMDETAATFVFLASAEASHLTGRVLPWPGGAPANFQPRFL